MAKAANHKNGLKQKSPRQVQLQLILTLLEATALRALRAHGRREHGFYPYSFMSTMFTTSMTYTTRTLTASGVAAVDYSAGMVCGGAGGTAGDMGATITPVALVTAVNIHASAATAVSGAVNRPWSHALYSALTRAGGVGAMAATAIAGGAPTTSPHRALSRVRTAVTASPP